MIREGLAGKRVVLTGVTGFLGTALLERLLTDTDVARIDCIARGDAPARIAGLLSGAAFGPAKQRLGEEELRRLFDAKVRATSVDLAHGSPTIADDIDVVIHSAATVSFDPPIDEAFTTNLLGSVRLYEAAKGKPFVHVSTAYVAGITRGTQPEELLDRDVDWRAEAEHAVRLRTESEEDSRRPEMLDKLAGKARALMGRAGPQSVAAKTEELRREWVKERMVRAGQARARSLGWPDVYAFTKALTEKALDELAKDSPLTIVRPSIIESALERPYPGWIEGFRVAEPIILGYGRGALPEFPGIPEGVLDLIPVDMVANAVLTVAARPPQRRAVYHVSSGGRNPLLFRKVYEHTRRYYLEHPLPERGRGAYKPPVWSFPGKRAVEKKMRIAERAIDVTERAATRLGRNSFARETVRKVDRLRGRLDFVKRYAALYGHYVEIEVIYTDERAQELFASLPPDDRRDFNFDPTSYTWEHYLGEIHLPAISAAMRWAAAMPPRPQPSVVIEPPTNGDSGKVVLAVFDVEGTIVDTNVVEAYLWLRMAEQDGVERARTVAVTAWKIPSLLKAERHDRGEFLRLFYRQYQDADPASVRALAAERLGDLFLRKLSPDAVRRIRDHKAAGHRIVFISGALDFVIEPVAGLADVTVTARLREENGVFTGDMERPPLVGEARASWLRDYARAHDVELSLCFAYADSMSDLPLLQAVGNPVAVNPDIGLARIARKERWPVEEWKSGRGTPKIMIPEAVVR
ncbi:MAG: HAD-IB family hydrolase [Actinomycetota bacterium]